MSNNYFDLYQYCPNMQMHVWLDKSSTIDLKTLPEPISQVIDDCFLPTTKKVMQRKLILSCLSKGKERKQTKRYDKFISTSKCKGNREVETSM